MAFSKLACVLMGTFLLLAPLDTSSAPRPQDWNTAIVWKTYEDGLAQAQREGKPICLVLYTTWCPHCTAYARMFHDAKVADASRQLVMIKVDTDASPEVGKKYSVDGAYIPRTYFLAPDGSIAKIESGRREYRYFYDEANPKPMHAAMQKALALAR